MFSYNKLKQFTSNLVSMNTFLIIVAGYKPEIKILLRKVKVAEGHSVVLPCETVGNPYPNIYWKRGHMKLVGRRYIIHRTGNLTIDVSMCNIFPILLHKKIFQSVI